MGGDSNLWYVTMDLGKRVLTFESGKGGLDGFAGFQFWREHYEAFGLRQIVCTTPPGVLCFPAGTEAYGGIKLISNTLEWSSFRLGLAADYQVSRVQVQGRLAFVPYTRLFNEDTHHARPDLRKPSATMKGDGLGGEGDIEVSLRVIAGLYLNVGYRAWYLHVYEGTLTDHPSAGGDTEVPLTAFHSLRHGVTLGAQYRF
jgi:hypothetical protein